MATLKQIFDISAHLESYRDNEEKIQDMIPRKRIGYRKNTGYMIGFGTLAITLAVLTGRYAIKDYDLLTKEIDTSKNPKLEELQDIETNLHIAKTTTNGGIADFRNFHDKGLCYFIGDFQNLNNIKEANSLVESARRAYRIIDLNSGNNIPTNMDIYKEVRQDIENMIKSFNELNNRQYKERINEQFLSEKKKENRNKYHGNIIAGTLATALAAGLASNENRKRRQKLMTYNRMDI